VTGDQYAVRGKIEAAIPLMLRGIAKEDTVTGARGELMGSGAREVRATGAPEDPKMGVAGSGV
jgi:hypothetical protein